MNPDRPSQVPDAPSEPAGAAESTARPDIPAPFASSPAETDSTDSSSDTRDRPPPDDHRAAEELSPPPVPYTLWAGRRPAGRTDGEADAPDPATQAESTESAGSANGAAGAAGSEKVSPGPEEESADRLHAFGRKLAPRAVRLESDLGVDSPDTVVGPYAPSRSSDKVYGASAFIDPERAPLNGHFHALPAGFEPPPGLGVHADGKDVGGREPWGHRTIYPTVPMSAARFQKMVAELQWVWIGTKQKKDKGEN